MKTDYTEKIFDAPGEETVCWCSGVSKHSIVDVICNGAQKMEDIRRITKACTLGRCKELSPRGRCCSKEINMLLDAANIETREK